MTAALPRPSRPSLTPPSAALPPLPSVKSRKTTISPTTPRAPGPGNRAVSTPSAIPPPSSSVQNNFSLANLSSTSKIAAPGVNGIGKTLRKTISIGAFPQPPKGSSRITSFPPSPLSGGSTPTSATATSPLGPAPTPRQLKRPNTLNASATSHHTGFNSASLLGSQGKLGSSAPGARGSDGLLSLPSPPQSRSSSAQGSYSTAATTNDDSGDYPKGQESFDDAVTDSDRNSKVKEGKGNVIVSVRVRPDASSQNDSSEGEWLVDGRRSLVSYRGREGGDYFYDNVFATQDKNDKVYDSSAKRLVRRVMEGYHGTVFAYGMTGTGKTFSMQGTTTSPGVIPLAITDIFSYIRETPHREFLLRVSYLEIYNEKIHDLLSAPTGALSGPGAVQQEEIKLREDSKRGVYASPLKEEIVQSPTQLLRVIARGDHARRTGSTQYNARSSRSHAVVQIVVESRERIPGNGSMTDNKRSGVPPGGVRVSTLSLIDLAGSERAAESKERRTEGAHINKSLLTLGTVIARLSGDKDKHGNPTDKDGKHLPYRDSKLTRLLQPALSGNSLVSILCTIQIGSSSSAASSHSHTGETLNTLKFAARAKNNIVSHAKKAEEELGVGNGAAVLLERYRMEILELRGQLDGQAKAKAEQEEKEKEKEAEARHGEQMLEMQLARTALKERIEHLNRLILCSKSTGVNSSGSFSSLGNHPRHSGLVNGHASVLSMRSSGTAPLEVPKSADRSSSLSSMSTIGQLPNIHDVLPRSVSEDEDSAGEYGDGTATFAAQVRALQADLADKNRYISTLEKRLLHARRSSHSRASLGFSPPHKAGVIGSEDNITLLLREKDAEIADLRTRLDDKDRMVTALRSSARARELAGYSIDLSEKHSRKNSKESDRSPVTVNAPGHISGPSNLIQPAPRGRTRGKSVDEMSRMLDEMIQDRVESGQLIKGSRGSVRLPTRESTLIEASAAHRIVISSD
ncbi:MAG: hypothetical protein M1829_003817 [Trizodia sp. TS-e1964]|nr:MAG: hypothetical protein M1829_003817 [Trizodia sp. TS-e1964]